MREEDKRVALLPFVAQQSAIRFERLQHAALDLAQLREQHVDGDEAALVAMTHRMQASARRLPVEARMHRVVLIVNSPTDPVPHIQSVSNGLACGVRS